MGRFVSGAGAGSQPRRQIVRLTASNPAVPVPAWAGIVYVSGCGGGGGGGNSTASSQRGGGGGAGGYAVRVPVPLQGAQTVSVVIGALGAGALASANAAGADAGNTEIVIGSVEIRLGGGKGGQDAAGGLGGSAILGTAADLGLAQNNHPVGVVADLSQGLSGPASPLASGAKGAPGNIPVQRYGAGGISPFGGGGAGITSLPAGITPGGDAAGYGAGGAGSQGAADAGDGTQGLLILEFEEAL